MPPKSNFGARAGLGMSDTEMAECTPIPNGGGRHEKSLGLLTAKFVDLLQGAEGGVLDLKKVCPHRP